MNTPPGFRRRSPLLAALGRGPRSGKATPRVVIAQVGVSPINRTMPAAVLHTTTPTSHSAPMQRLPGDTAGEGPTPSNSDYVTGDEPVRGNPGATTPAITAVAPDPAVFQRGNPGTLTPTSHSAPMQPATAPSVPAMQQTMEQLVGQARPLPQGQAPQNLQTILPVIHGLITQMLAGQRPAAWQNILGQTQDAVRGMAGR